MFIGANSMTSQHSKLLASSSTRACEWAQLGRAQRAHTYSMPVVREFPRPEHLAASSGDDRLELANHRGLPAQIAR
jgi:hypothetical protein